MVAPNLRVIHLVAGAEAFLPKQTLGEYIAEFTMQLLSFVDKEGLSYDFISAHYYYSGLIGLEVKKHLEIPLGVTFHTLALMKNLVARGDDERESLERVEAELMLVKQVDHIFATSERDANYLETLYSAPKAKVSILTPGVDLQLFHPADKVQAKQAIGATNDSQLILFVGRIEPLKGIDVLLYAIKILLQKHPELKLCLYIVGGDVSESADQWSKELQKLEKLRTLLGIEASVHFVGRKKQEELPDYYNAAEIVVMPSQYESFGITALEAMASGVPVITTDVTGVSGLLDSNHASLVTSANNPMLLAEKIKNLLIDKDMYQKTSQEVYAKVQDLSWKKVVERFLRLCVMGC
jgi:D-inositol-3-phosphate glycosyltransferase